MVWLINPLHQILTIFHFHPAILNNPGEIKKHQGFPHTDDTGVGGL
ncbi:MAG: hypothetical protein QG657_3951 [Acidobacteriota bacterium]|nr:hypothetical protein [Acidobacteriota bacterium]